MWMCSCLWSNCQWQDSVSLCAPGMPAIASAWPCALTSSATSQYSRAHNGTAAIIRCCRTRCSTCPAANKGCRAQRLLGIKVTGIHVAKGRHEISWTLTL
eukprot:1151234-Pelagomonas_calceolata.AAC.2